MESIIGKGYSDLFGSNLVNIFQVLIFRDPSATFNTVDSFKNIFPLASKMP